MTLVSGSCVLETKKPQEMEPCQMNKVFKAIFNQEYLAQDLIQYKGDSQVMKGYLLLSPEMVYESTEITGKKISKVSCRVSVCCQEKFVANVAFVGPEFLGISLSEKQVQELELSFLETYETTKTYSPSMVFSRGNFSKLDQNALAVNPNSLSQPIPVVELSGTFPIVTVNGQTVSQGQSNKAMTGSSINTGTFKNSTYTVAGAVLIQVFVPKSPKAIVCVKAELGIELST